MGTDTCVTQVCRRTFRFIPHIMADANKTIEQADQVDAWKNMHGSLELGRRVNTRVHNRKGSAWQFSVLQPSSASSRSYREHFVVSVVCG
jgi:hypothetical protein